MRRAVEYNSASVASHTCTIEFLCSRLNHKTTPIQSFTTIKTILIFLLSLFTIHHSLFAQKDLKLWYNQPAQKWTDALPIGNGNLGAMIYGGINEEHLQFNESTLWTGKPRDYTRKGAYKYLQPIRDLLNQGKQKDAEALAGKEFMGMKDVDDSVYEIQKKDWIQKV
ncbi:MAG: glycoside hydrolase N-terminal domain-containing protein, partial [Pedobacter sp.]|nr:glycoside hydrolase N-terminal domain-containing protein [Chitinophagaceae bacterium]